MNFNAQLRSARRFSAAVLKRALFLVVAMPALGQIAPDQISAPLAEEILSPQVSLQQVRRFVLDRVAKPPSPTRARQWTSGAKRLREHLLKDVVFHGWPRDVITSPPKFEEVGVIETGKGYRIRKYRYEVFRRQELFCLDLLKYCDLDRFEIMSAAQIGVKSLAAGRP